MSIFGFKPQKKMKMNIVIYFFNPKIGLHFHFFILFGCLIFLLVIQMFWLLHHFLFVLIVLNRNFKDARRFSFHQSFPYNVLYYIILYMSSKCFRSCPTVFQYLFRSMNAHFSWLISNTSSFVFLSIKLMLSVHFQHHISISFITHVLHSYVLINLFLIFRRIIFFKQKFIFLTKSCFRKSYALFYLPNTLTIRCEFAS